MFHYHHVMGHGAHQVMSPHEAGRWQPTNGLGGHAWQCNYARLSYINAMQILNRITSLSLRISESHYACMTIHIMNVRPLIQKLRILLMYSYYCFLNICNALAWLYIYTTILSTVYSSDSRIKSRFWQQPCGEWLVTRKEVHLATETIHSWFMDRPDPCLCVCHVKLKLPSKVPCEELVARGSNED